MPYPFSAGEILTATNLNAAVGMVPIAANAPTSGTTTTFSSIPSTYTHLRVVARPMHNNGSAANAHRGMYVQFNGDTTAVYNALLHSWDGAGTLVTAQADAATGATVAYIADTRAICMFDVVYSNLSASTHELMASGSSRINNSSAGTGWREFKGSGLWIPAVSTAITSMTIGIASGGGDVFATGSIFTLYGLISP